MWSVMTGCFLFDIFPFLFKVLKAAPLCRSLRRQTHPGTNALRYHTQVFLFTEILICITVYCFVFCKVIFSNLVSAEVVFATDIPDETEGLHSR